MTWNKAIPVSGSKILATPSIFGNNWESMDDILSKEHYGMTSSLSGRHKPGLVGTIYVGTNAQIAALTTPTTGALAYVTNAGSGVGLIRSSTSTWKVINNDLNVTRVQVYADASEGYTINADTYANPVHAGQADINSLVEYKYNASRNIYSFKPYATGYFAMAMTITLSTTFSGEDSVDLGFSGSGILEYTTITTLPSGYAAYSYSTLVSSNSGVDIMPFAYCYTKTIKISGGAGVSYVDIWRIS